MIVGNDLRNYKIALIFVDKKDGEQNKMGSECTENDQTPTDLDSSSDGAILDGNDLNDFVVEHLPLTPGIR